MLLKFPDGKVANVDEKRLQVGDVVSDWEFKGNTTNPGNSYWNEWENIKTGESTLKTFTPQTVTCDNDNHYFKMLDNNFNFTCVKCSIGGKLQPHKMQIKKGKIIYLASE